MKRFSVILLLPLFLASAPVSAGEIREIVLKDGTVMVGEVVSLDNGVYTVRTESLGAVTIDETKIQAIRQKGAPAASPDVNEELRSLQERMAKDNEIMSLIESLRNDPDFQKILADPDVMKAVNAGDIGALTANPDFMKLLQHSTVRDIKKKVGE